MPITAERADTPTSMTSTIITQPMTSYHLSTATMRDMGIPLITNSLSTCKHSTKAELPTSKSNNTNRWQSIAHLAI